MAGTTQGQTRNPKAKAKGRRNPSSSSQGKQVPSTFPPKKKPKGGPSDLKNIRHANSIFGFRSFPATFGPKIFFSCPSGQSKVKLTDTLQVFTFGPPACWFGGGGGQGNPQEHKKEKKKGLIFLGMNQR